MTPQRKKIIVIVVIIAIVGAVIFLKKKSDKGGLFANRPKYDKSKPISISNRPGANLD